MFPRFPFHDHILKLAEMSRQLGFLRFQNISFSRAFMEQNFPNILLYGPSAGPNDRGTKVRIAFSREREDRVRARAEGDWVCKMVRVPDIFSGNKTG
jgi:hypothetical protein